MVEVLGVRLVGFDSDTLAKLLLTAAIVAVALVVRTAVGATAGRTMHRTTRRSVWILEGISLAFGMVISIASATFELVKAPELSIRPVDGRPRPEAGARGAPWDAP